MFCADNVSTQWFALLMDGNSLLQRQGDGERDGSLRQTNSVKCARNEMKSVGSENRPHAERSETQAQSQSSLSDVPFQVLQPSQVNVDYWNIGLFNVLF